MTSENSRRRQSSLIATVGGFRRVYGERANLIGGSLDQAIERASTRRRCTIHGGAGMHPRALSALGVGALCQVLVR